MECPLCMQENEMSKRTKGYGCGYIGKRFNCLRHDVNDNRNKNGNANENSQYLNDYYRNLMMFANDRNNRY